MNINRNNYEEFFLMYVDGELNNHQLQMVEVFVQQNPDLQTELNMLLNTKLVTTEEFAFDKSILYKNAAQSINATNAEENFLLYVDNELNNSAKAEVETFVLQHPAYQSNFSALKNTVLPVEAVVCPDKESLYKKEEKPVIFMWAKRLSVAAAFLLFAVLAWFLVPSNNTNTKNAVAKNNDTQTQKNSSASVTSTTTKPLNTETATVQNSEQKLPVKKDFVIGTVNKTAKNNQQENIPNTPEMVVAKSQQQTINTTTTNTQPQQKEQIAVIADNSKRNENAVAAVTKNNDVIASNTINKQETTTIVQPLLYRQLDIEESDKKNEMVYIGNVEVSKSKLNNLFKKAKKIFGRSKKNEDSENSNTTNSNIL